MPPLLPVPQTAKVIVKGHLGSVVANNVFHVDYAADFLGAVQAPLLAASFYAAYCTAFQGLFATGSVIDQCIVQDIASDTGATGEHDGTTGGTNLSPPGPANVAACITWHVATHYKGGHPRTYLPFVPNNQCTDGRTWTSSYQALLSAAAPAFLTAINGIGSGAGGPVTLVAVHRAKHKVLLTPPTTEPITAGSVDARVDSMRRRLGRDVPG